MGKCDKTKVAMLLSAMDPEDIHRYNHFTWGKNEDKTKFLTVINKFDLELGDEKCLVFKQFKFWDYRHSEHQPFDEYFTQLKPKAELCEIVKKDNMI